MKIASERTLDPKDQILFRAFRQGYQSLRERIRENKPLEWYATPRAGRMTGFREYRAFKAMGEYVAFELANSPTRPKVPWSSVPRPTNGASIDAFLTITMRDDSWCLTAERELHLSPAVPR